MTSKVFSIYIQNNITFKTRCKFGKDDMRDDMKDEI